MEITRGFEKNQYIEWDFYDWLINNDCEFDSRKLEDSLDKHYFTESEEIPLLDFCKKNPVFGMAKYCDTILLVNNVFYLIPDEMVDNDSQKTVKFFEKLAETIYKTLDK